MELRKDYILDRWVIISEARKRRPRDLERKEQSTTGSTCVFCPGSEHLTPKEIGRIGEPWQVRWFDNLFAFTELKGSPEVKTDNTFYTYGNPFGEHEVIVETPDHTKQVWDLTHEELLNVFRAYGERIRELAKKPATRWVAVFKNHGREGGASLQHAHSQVVSFNIDPPQIKDEIAACKRFPTCPYCQIIQSEKDSYRKIKQTASWASFTPYASRFNYEAWIFPKRHVTNFLELSDDERSELVGHIYHIYAALKHLDLPFNMFFHYPTQGSDLHFHVEITPRGGIWAGFEFTTAITVNSVSPEYAASFYRGEIDELGNPHI